MKSLYLFTDIHPKLLFPSTHAISAWTSHHQAFQVDSGWSAAPFNHIKLLRTRTIITIGFICIYIYTVCIYIYVVLRKSIHELVLCILKLPISC